MSRAAVLNIVLAVLAASIVVTVVYLETSGEDAAATTTTSTTTTSTTTTTTIAPTTTSSPSTTSTSTSTTTSTTTTTVEQLPLFPRENYALLVVNGSSQGARLDPTIGLLRLVGYANIRGAAGAVLTPESSIYYLEEPFRDAAVRLADDVGMSLDQLAPFSESPPIAARGDAQLIIYLGGS